jgi:hypothetical protein
VLGFDHPFGHPFDLALRRAFRRRRVEKRLILTTLCGRKAGQRQTVFRRNRLGLTTLYAVRRAARVTAADCGRRTRGAHQRPRAGRRNDRPRGAWSHCASAHARARNAAAHPVHVVAAMPAWLPSRSVIRSDWV